MSKQILAIAQRELGWRDRLARQAVSGQTIAGFCRSEAVTEGTFYAWRARLGAKKLDATRPKETTQSSSAFIDIGAINDVAANKSTPVGDVNRGSGREIEVRIDLGQGVVLQMVRR